MDSNCRFLSQEKPVYVAEGELRGDRVGIRRGVMVRSQSGTLVIIDAGTGAAVLGRELVAAGGKVRGHILIGHTHRDHIQGFPFFAPEASAVSLRRQLGDMCGIKQQSGDSHMAPRGATLLDWKKSKGTETAQGGCIL